jgi:2-methylisocitrate lyase-like PEP mutase family enzyme
LDDTIRRLRAYQAAGADVLYTPGLFHADDIAAVVRSIERPLNVLMGFAGVRLGLATLTGIGLSAAVQVEPGGAPAGTATLLRRKDCPVGAMVCVTA